MNTYRDSNDERIRILARRAGVERSLYLGEAIGNTLLIASNGLASLGAWLGRAMSRNARSVKQHA